MAFCISHDSSSAIIKSAPRQSTDDDHGILRGNRNENTPRNPVSQECPLESWRRSARLIPRDIQRGTRSVICYRHEASGRLRGPPTIGARPDRGPAARKESEREKERSIFFTRFEYQRLPLSFPGVATLTRQWTRSEIQGGWLKLWSFLSRKWFRDLLGCLRTSVTKGFPTTRDWFICHNFELTSCVGNAISLVAFFPICIKNFFPPFSLEKGVPLFSHEPRNLQMSLLQRTRENIFFCFFFLFLRRRNILEIARYEVCGNENVLC